MRARFLLPLVLAACASPEETVRQQPCGAAGDPCPSCTTVADCAGSCDGAACACEAGLCVAHPCSADAECTSGRICSGGACAAPAPGELVRACDVEPRHLLLRQGDHTQLHVLPRGDDGPLRTDPPVLTLDGLGVTLDADGVLTGGPTAGAFSVTASYGSVTCSASGTGLGAAPAALRVVVSDAFTGLPVPDAIVRVESAGGPLVARTSASGAALIEGAPAGPRTITVFPAEHGYVTLAGVEGDELAVPVRRRTSPEDSGGFRGEFGPAELFDSTTTLQIGLAGTAVSSDLTDLSLDQLLGPIVRVTVPIGQGLPLDLPAGVTLGLGRTWFKQSYTALGLPGLCADAARDGDGSCGLRTAWGLAGGVPLSAVPADLLQGKTVETAALLSAILPYSDALSSAVRRGVGYDLVPHVDGAPDEAAFSRLDLQATAPLALAVPVEVPRLPSALRPLSFVIALAAAREPGGSLVPLGITAGSDVRPSDGAVDEALELHLAPAHAGLGPSPYAILVLAIDPTSDPDRCSTADDGGCPSASAMVLTSPALPHQQPVSFEGPLLPPPEAATFDATARTFDGSAVAGSPTLLRLILSSPSGRTWTLLTPPGLAQLPPAPAGLEDLVEEPGVLLRVQSMRSRAGLSELAWGKEARLSDLLPHIAAFASLDRPL